MKKLSINRKLYIVLFVLFFTSYFAKAQYVFQINDSLQKAMNYVYEFRYTDAKKIVVNERKNNPKNVACDFIEATMSTFLANFNDNPQYFEEMKSSKRKYLDQINKLDNNNPWKNNLSAQLAIQAALVHIKYEEYYTSFKELRSANKSLNSNQKIKSDFFPDLLPNGMLNVMISTIPDNIRWISETFGLTGDYETGMQNMELALLNASKNKNYLWLESQSLMCIAMVQMSLGDNPEQIIKIKNLLENHLESIKENPFLMNTLASLNVKTGNNERAIELLENVLHLKQSSEYPILYYQLGRYKLQRMDVDAYRPFLSYLAHYKYDKCIKASYQQIAWSYYLQGNQQKYFENIKKVENAGSTKNGADKAAENEFKKGTPPNKDLLIARLLFDGGYFDKALETLQKTNQNLLSESDKLELDYRKGRVYHGLKNYEQATIFYKRTVEQGEKSTSYFAANSALMLGNIYELQKNYNQAIAYYKKCQIMKSDEYEYSIHQKAKVGENRCKKNLK